MCVCVFFLSRQVLAGALQDDCRAVLRGERTFGKGLVQAVYGLAGGEGLILTVAQYETPRGTYIHVRRNDSGRRWGGWGRWGGGGGVRQHLLCSPLLSFFFFCYSILYFTYIYAVLHILSADLLPLVEGTAC